MTAYERGTVAELTLESGAKVRGLRTSKWGWRTESLGDFYHDREVTDVRPLIVLDLHGAGKHIDGAGEAARYAIRTLRESCWISDGLIADQIEAQTKPAKPAEPTGLGAVVEDASGVHWVRVPEDGNPARSEWVCSHSTCRTWDAINAVRVLSEGVTA